MKILAHRGYWKEPNEMIDAGKKIVFCDVGEKM